MPKKTKNEETFNDGILNVVEINNRTMVKDVIKNIHFGNKTVGSIRFYNAATAGTKIDKLISVPFNRIIDREHLIEINNVVYSIKQIQEKHDTIPASLYLSLEKEPILYNDKRKN